MIKFLTGARQKIERDNQFHLNVTGIEFFDNFSTGTSKRDKFLTRAFTVTYAIVSVRQGVWDKGKLW